MAKYEWSEVFLSVEGEARWAGWPTVYIRFARCNFTCRGFNNPEWLDTSSHEVLGFNPAEYDSIQKIPLIRRGCDSIYSWHPSFSHMWHKGDEKELTAEVLKVLPHNTFVNPKSGKRVILSLTGGEPTIRLKFWVPLLEELYQHGMRSILVETNCASPLRDTDLKALYDWVNSKDQAKDNQINIIWSNSPKLSSSGEEWTDAIRPEIAFKQIFYDNGVHANWPRRNTQQYFKFVCGPNDKDFDEIADAMNWYYESGIPKSVDIYAMPVACISEQQDEISAKVAKMCIDRGIIYCHRIQMIFGNGVGT